MTDKEQADQAAAQEKAAQEQKDKAAQEQQATTTQVRILVDHRDGDRAYRCDTVETLPKAKAAKLVKAGIADDNPEAVKAAAQPAQAAE